MGEGFNHIGQAHAMDLGHSWLTFNGHQPKAVHSNKVTEIFSSWGLTVQFYTGTHHGGISTAFLGIASNESFSLGFVGAQLFAADQTYTDVAHLLDFVHFFDHFSDLEECSAISAHSGDFFGGSLDCEVHTVGHKRTLVEGLVGIEGNSALSGSLLPFLQDRGVERAHETA